MISRSGEASRQHALDESETQQQIEGEELVEEDDQPEEDLVTGLGGLVTELALSDEASGPAADKFREVENGFGDAPFATLGAALVVTNGKVGDERNRRGGGRDDAPIGPSGQTDQCRAGKER